MSTQRRGRSPTVKKRRPKPTILQRSPAAYGLTDRITIRVQYRLTFTVPQIRGLQHHGVAAMTAADKCRLCNPEMYN